jgi:signal transduction histidine kinase
MTPQPTEPLVSLPVGWVILGLLLIVGAVVLLALRLARRGAAERAVPPPAIERTPWLASLLAGLPQAAMVVDADGQPIAWNESAAQFLLPAGGASELPSPLKALVARAIAAHTAETIEIALPAAPRQRLRVTASPLEAVDGSAAPSQSGALVLAQSPAHGGRSAESYRRLVSAVAHELRTPLTAILGHADILGSCRQEEEALWQRSRGFIASEAERLARLVEDLLTLSRLDLTPLQRRPVNLRAVVEEAISTLFRAAEAHGVSLALQSPPSLPRVSGDRDRLQQVFVNLLDNAIKYASDGGEAVVRLRPEADAVSVEVCDDGIGISPEDLPHIFDSLFRGQHGRDIPGTGLGLAIVRTILEQHGATIEVQSAPGRGTTFQYCLPFARSSISSLT